MKELHNHIFSNTTCISKETMLRYINKQLQKDELYEAEKHMLDCELCSEAYEGMKFATNSSVLFAIDNQIDQRVSGGNYKAPIMRNLMVAASLLVIIFGAYFSISYFNNTINENKNLAFNNVKAPNEEKAVEKNEEMELESILNNQENLNTTATSGKDAGLLLEDEEGEKQEDKYSVAVNEPITITTEQSPEINDVVSGDYLYMDEVEAIEDEVVLASKGAGEIANKTKGESEKQLEFFDGNTDNRREDNASITDQPTPSSVSTEAAFLSNAETTIDKSDDDSKNEVKKEKNKKGGSLSKKRAKSRSAGYYADGKLEEAEVKEIDDRKQQSTVTINSYKVVDYTEEFQKEYDLKQTVETKSVTADFETKADKDIAEKERDETIVEITYKETLEKAIALYKSENYNAALVQFDIILSKHPEEVNGWFYGGLSNYHLKKYGEAEGKLNKVLINKNEEFNEEATWYKALSLIELKQIDKAKKILKGIIDSNGFYKAKAGEKLKTL
jgi:hypothetical protein